MKERIMNFALIILALITAFTFGGISMRWYIMYGISQDISVNLKEENKTIKNVEVTNEKIRMFNYIKDKSYNKYVVTWGKRD